MAKKNNLIFDSAYKRALKPTMNPNSVQPISTSKETYIVNYSIPLFGIRIAMRVFAVLITGYFLYNGDYLILFLTVSLYLFSLSYNAIEIDFDKQTYFEYYAVLGLKWGNRGHLSSMRYILLMDVIYIERNRRGRIVDSGNECYEVALVGDNRLKLVLLYSYGEKETIDRVYELQEKTGLPLKDITKEKLMGSDEDVG